MIAQLKMNPRSILDELKTRSMPHQFWLNSFKSEFNSGIFITRPAKVWFKYAWIPAHSQINYAWILVIKIGKFWYKSEFYSGSFMAISDKFWIKYALIQINVIICINSKGTWHMFHYLRLRLLCDVTLSSHSSHSAGSTRDLRRPRRRRRRSWRRWSSS
jgi:hypothetical protein